jgi:acyl-coenzyme A synthetase/AMP-(fatty) acid ligase
VFVDALPKNNYGKILKTELRELDSRQLRIP